MKHRYGLIVLVILARLGFSAAAAEEPALANPSTYLRDVCALLDQAWPGNRSVTIVCHGHSVPAGYFKTPAVDTFNAYPHLLHVGLKQRHPLAVINVIEAWRIGLMGHGATVRNVDLVLAALKTVLA